MQQPNLSHTTQHPLPPNPALFQQLYQMGQQYSVPHTPTPLAFNVRQQQQKQRSLPTAPLIHSSSTSTTVPAPAPVNSTPLPKPSKRLSAHAQPFVPTTPLPPPHQHHSKASPTPSGYQSAFTPHATHRHPYAYNQSIFQQHNSFRSRDDMEGVIGFSSARRGAGKRSWTQSRHSLRNRNDEVDYYYSEDDDLHLRHPRSLG
ncbi:hypothetical protein BCR33DRAFT_503307 [Rhizoclosmatium globosum]|uniref:Uncharacterized protein n=1 Tax=Rhizoclosmatium globosum TaxID=329046 RepID=A0A1Y2CVQ2_9FUNG|nr:hypothetical protein BCR33DRAFT_503307 [Rhizoclosmatium globosum]|eukprot:ORY51120.1 hypothetical protein BCR33DRAFT_503307 [Rhizoclosmatium globosum]